MKTPIENLQAKINNLCQRRENMSYLEKKKAREIQQLIIDQSQLDDDIMIAEYDLAKLKNEAAR